MTAVLRTDHRRPSSAWASSPRRLAGLACWLACLAATAGCGGPSAGAVSGVVTHRGAPVKGAIVNFYAPELGAAAQAPLDDAGAFRIPEPLPVGRYKVYLQAPPPPQLPPGSPPAAPLVLTVPASYQDAAQTPLTLEVKAGDNQLPIEITD